MSDSDDDLMADSVARLQHHTFMNRRAPNMNETNITSFSFGNNMMTSRFRSKYEIQRNGMQDSNQKNIYNGRETSPMSPKSLPDSRMEHFRNYPNATSGSASSIRSIDSNVSAADIVLALKNIKCTKNDLSLIKDAYNKLIKNQTRKKIKKRRNLKLFLKGYRRKSGEDSGEQGSDSSISSDDCKSKRTFYKQNRSRSGPKSTITDITHFRSTIQKSDMFRDCTERFKQTKFRNMFAINKTNVNNADNDDTIFHQKHKNSQEKPQPNMAMVTLKDRFTKSTNSVLLPSQRFNMSAINSKNREDSTNTKRDVLRTNNDIILEEHSKSLDSDSEEIFSEITMRENTHIQRKRALEDSEINSPDKKSYKAAPATNLNDLTSVTNSDFNFKKSQMPVRKSGNHKKDSAPERIIVVSKPLIGNLDLDISKKLPKHLDDTQNKLPVNSTEIEESTNQTETTQNSTDVSMRSSSNKRKLATQKLGVAENNNISSDDIGANSPQANKYSQCREKNKVRKLVTSQSCLSRDVLGDDIALDLIHKIVPPDKIDMTIAATKKEVNKSNDNDKSVISTCDVGNVSDTFTGEEIFKATNKLDNKTKKDQKVNENVAGNNTILSKPMTNEQMTQCNVEVILAMKSLLNKTGNSGTRCDISGVSKRNIESQENKDNNNTLNETNKNMENNKNEDETQSKEKDLKNTKSKMKKNEKKVENTLKNDVVKRPRGRPRKCAENVDSIKSNLNKNSKES